ncbi:pilus assembly protein PilM [Oribacterium sp. oral taxon 102]|uniref:pilus assembly protein PilM n=1 Tax=Oribacterium sp. oral taxon 102 TaxID=671214 RepID=UPI0015BDDB02|nr:pilus assembly protein PilM [Oribacterium sp. oral taxon 102]NWO21904.1 pilus assembly protein PilM [Oribacterium sp. oral taxon 102]
MKPSQCLGIDIGNYRVKICYVNRGTVQDFFLEPLPENIVQNGVIQAWAALGEFLREILKKHGIRCRNAVFSVPLSVCYLRKLELPLMTVDQLRTNLPYEFHDYIAEEAGEYYYDYSVLQRTERTLVIQAAAMSKQLIDRYRELQRFAKLNLLGLIPEPLAYQRLLRHYNEANAVSMDQDYAVLDMGEQALRIHFFSEGWYETTRTLETGGRNVVERVSERSGSDSHIVRLRIEADQDGILGSDELRQLYEADAVQLMRVLNFYSFNNPKNTIDALYCCGGGVNAEPMLHALTEQISLPVRLLTELMGTVPEPYRRAAAEGPQAYGVTLPLDHSGDIPAEIPVEEG